MTINELNKHKVDLSKRGCVPAKNYNGRWSCSYGENGLSIQKHNYMTKNDAMISVFDVWKDFIKGEYAGRGFIFWVIISILVDIAAFIFFDIAFKKSEY